MARVLAFVPDLLFGSNVQSRLQAAGHQVALVADPAGADSDDIDVVVVDLTVEPDARIAAVQRTGLLEKATLAFYSHVEQDVRALAEEAGFDLVVPRSRMAREGPELVALLSA